jgi:hypothetical protein
MIMTEVDTAKNWPRIQEKFALLLKRKGIRPELQTEAWRTGANPHWLSGVYRDILRANELVISQAMPLLHEYKKAEIPVDWSDFPPVIAQRGDKWEKLSEAEKPELWPYLSGEEQAKLVALGLAPPVGQPQASQPTPAEPTLQGLLEDWYKVHRKGSTWTQPCKDFVLAALGGGKQPLSRVTAAGLLEQFEAYRTAQKETRYKEYGDLVQRALAWGETTGQIPSKTVTDFTASVLLNGKTAARPKLDRGHNASGAFYWVFDGLSKKPGWYTEKQVKAILAGTPSPIEKTPVSPALGLEADIRQVAGLVVLPATEQSLRSLVAFPHFSSGMKALVQRVLDAGVTEIREGEYEIKQVRKY